MKKIVAPLIALAVLLSAVSCKKTEDAHEIPAPVPVYKEGVFHPVMKLASIIINFMPIVVVCSVTSVIITTGANTLLSLMGMFATFIVGLLIMMILLMLWLIVEIILWK